METESINMTLFGNFSRIPFNELIPINTSDLDTNNTFIDYIDASQMLMFRAMQWMYIYVIPVLATFGIIGNVWSFKVFVFTSFNRHPSSTYLVALSVSDTGFLTALLFSWISSIKPSLNQSIVWCRITIYITYVCSFLSVWYVVLIMIDRYIVVCFPFKAQILCSKRRSRWAVTAVTVFALVLYLYSFFTIEIQRTPEGDTCSWNSETFKAMEVLTYIDTGVTFVIPFLAIFILNVIVITAIKKFRYRQILLCEKTNQPLNALSSAQFRMTTMLVIVSTVLLVLNLPSHGIRFYLLVNQLMEKTTIGLLLAQQVCQILYYINFAINFILYSVASKVFRRVMCRPVRVKNKCVIRTKPKTVNSVV